MCACKETDVRESPNDSTLASRERQGSCGEMCYAMFDENPVSSLPECSVFPVLFNGCKFIKILGGVTVPPLVLSLLRIGHHVTPVPPRVALPSLTLPSLGCPLVT
jgi:hypothetical protein